jgi:hypothetical protein
VLLRKCSNPTQTLILKPLSPTNPGSQGSKSFSCINPVRPKENLSLRGTQNTDSPPLNPVLSLQAPEVPEALKPKNHPKPCKPYIIPTCPRSVLLIVLIVCRGGAFFLEQPGSSQLAWHPRVRWLFQKLPKDGSGSSSVGSEFGF